MSLRRVAPPRVFTAPALAAAFGLVPPAATAELVFNQVALTGNPAPGVADGAEFNSFATPTLNAAGDVAFRAFLRTGDAPGAGTVDGNNQEAIFGPVSGSGTPLSVLAREDQTAPGVADGAEFNFFVSNPTLNAAGDVAFRALLRTGDGPGAGTVDGNNQDAIFGPVSGSGTALSVLARADQTAPGVTDGAEFNGFTTPTLNAAGDVAFFATLRTGDGPGAGTVDGNNRDAIFGPGSGSGTPLSVLAREDQAAPGVADGAEFNFFVNNPTLNAAGDVAFRALLRTGDGPGAGTVDGNNQEVIFGPVSGSGTALSVLAREDQTAPGVADGAEFNSFGIPTLNAAGDVAFFATLRTGDGPGAGTVDGNNQDAIFGPVSGSGTALSVLAREDQTAPGVADGAEFNFFSGNPTLNAAGDVAFLAFLRTGDGPGAGTVDGNNQDAIFGPGTGPGTALSVLAREDQTAPGVADGAEFNSFGIPTLNAAGDVAFLASLRMGDGPGAGAVDFTNNIALFALVDGELELVLREGDLFEVDPADALAEARTISQITFDSDTSDGSTGFNDAGTLAFGLTFTDGTSGVFTVTVPEPGAGVALLTALGGLLRRRRAG